MRRLVYYSKTIYMRQTTNQLLMIRPVAFRLNEETAVNNFFQKEMTITESESTLAAQIEFDELVNKLRAVGVRVTVVNDLEENNTPDSIFPNNWISFHEGGKVVLYPMFAENRRKERRQEVMNAGGDSQCTINEVIDLSNFETKNKFLEGTGSLVLDRKSKKAYCALSDRSNEVVLNQFCNYLGYTQVIFVANQTVNNGRKAIYHTNVMMTIAENFAIICLDTIDNDEEAENVIQNLNADGKEIIEITTEQMHSFAGNMLQVAGTEDEKYLVMSQRARNSLSEEQVSKIEAHCPIVSSELTAIETLGGGSARCMMTEVF